MEKRDDRTIESGFLPVGDGHELYYEVWGNPAGRDVLFFHGGPGYGCTPADKTLFDPEECKVTFFDQRGSGQSRFRDPFRANHTENLLTDIQSLRDHLGIGPAVLVGGSWGSTLALLHAMTVPHLVTAIVIRAFFPANKECIDVMTDQNNALVVPEAYLDFVSHVPRNARNNMIAYYAKTLRHGNRQQQVALAAAWHALGKALGRVDSGFEIDLRAIRHAAITAHYADNICFLPDNYLYQNADRFDDIPIQIIHGKQDLLCPLDFAEAFDDLVPSASLQIVDAGHSVFDDTMFLPMIKAIEKAVAICGN